MPSEEVFFLCLDNLSEGARGPCKGEPCKGCQVKRSCTGLGTEVDPTAHEQYLPSPPAV